MSVHYHVARLKETFVTFSSPHPYTLWSLKEQRKKGKSGGKRIVRERERVGIYLYLKKLL